MEEDEIIKAVFENQDQLPSCAERVYKQLLPSHPWLLLGTKSDLAEDTDLFYMSMHDYARRRGDRFKGLEHVLLNNIQPRHDVEPVSLASLFG